jgi:L-amino acid N-acyltransferase YncA
MGIVIRPAAIEDAASMVDDVLNPIIRAGTYSALDRPYSVDEQAAFIRTFPEHGVFLVAADSATDQVAGMQDVVSRPPEPGDAVGWVSTFVALDRLRSGIGRALCAATVPRARAVGFRTLCAAIRADNPQALAFYESQGFVPVAVVEGGAVVRGVPVDQVLAEKRLG